MPEIVDHPGTPVIGVAYPMELVQGSTVGHTAANGATRFVPGTQHSREPVPSFEEEPRWMKLNVAAPVPAGTAMIRDIRTWHGGTPNLTESVRAIPGAGYSAPGFIQPGSNTQLSGSKWLPPDLLAQLSPAGRRACREVVLLPGERCEKQWVPAWQARELTGDHDSRSGRSLRVLPRL